MQFYLFFLITLTSPTGHPSPPPALPDGVVEPPDYIIHLPRTRTFLYHDAEAFQCFHLLAWSQTFLMESALGVTGWRDVTDGWCVTRPKL